jgi:hypothetical protein
MSVLLRNTKHRELTFHTDPKPQLPTTGVSRSHLGKAVQTARVPYVPLVNLGLRLDDLLISIAYHLHH